ncbi:MULTISPECIES: retropepsin-like aspartic protease [unclassified Myroides]|uniref:retropepsin-like aspartic protease n=1 Tax=unclassified Myroides TaxID=2642485 RepID=UPI0031017B47
MSLKKIVLAFFVLFGTMSSAQTIRLPYTDESGWMLVNLTVNDKEMTFLFDTGWDGLSIRGSLLDGYKKAGSIAAVDANNVLQDVAKMRVDSLKVGNYVFHNLPFTDLEQFPMVKDPIFDCYKIDGILGNVIYKDKVLEIDPIKKEIILEDFSRALELRILSDDFIHVASLNDQNPTRIVIPMAVGGMYRPFLVDTGDNGYLSVSRDRDMVKYIETLAVKSFLSYGSVGAFGLNKGLAKTQISVNGRIQLADRILNEQELAFSPSEGIYQIGVEFIKQFHMIYMADLQLLFLKQVRRYEGESNLNKFGYGIAYQEGKYIIAAISENEKVLKIGDEVITIDGVAISEICGYRKYFQIAKDTPKLGLKRGKKEFEY